MKQVFFLPKTVEAQNFEALLRFNLYRVLFRFFAPALPEMGGRERVNAQQIKNALPSLLGRSRGVGLRRQHNLLDLHRNALRINQVQVVDAVASP